jgi:hypothetical protein
LIAFRCFFLRDLPGIRSKSASINQKIHQNQSKTKYPNRLLDGGFSFGEPLFFGGGEQVVMK